MAQNGPGLSIFSVFANAGSQQGGTQNSGDAAHIVYRGGTGKIMEAQVGKPTAAPNPVATDGVYNETDGCGVETVCGKVGAFCHGAGNNGGSCGAKYRLEYGKNPQGQAVAQKRIVAPNQWVKAAHQGTGAEEHQAKAYQPKTRCADTEVHHIFHQNIARIFGTGQAAFTKGETGLHEEHQKCSD